MGSSNVLIVAEVSMAFLYQFRSLGGPRHGLYCCAGAQRWRLCSVPAAYCLTLLSIFENDEKLYFSQYFGLRLYIPYLFEGCINVYVSTLHLLPDLLKN